MAQSKLLKFAPEISLRSFLRFNKFGSWFVVLFCAAMTNALCHGQSLKGFGNNLVKVKVAGGKELLGQPLTWDGHWMKVLRRSGQISTVKVKSKSQLTDTRRAFTGYTMAQMQKALQREFGSNYEVTISSDFIVVHPVGKFETFGKPYAQVKKCFNAYFQNRNVQLARPKAPMVAVVLNTRNEFDRMIAGYKNMNSKHTGYYSSTSNRTITYDISNDSSREFSASTIVHEATHQCAYNYGIHNRLHKPPMWAVEGLACMYEAPAFYDAERQSKSDKINTSRLRSLKKHLKTGVANNKLSSIVGNDNLFQTNSSLAYAYAWGLTFFLAETQPEAYVEFLQKDASRNSSPKAGRDRLAIFAKVFGNDTRRLEADMFEFIEEL